LRDDGRMTRARPPIARRLAGATLVPLGLVALAYALWWISDRLLYVGPMDRATFGWAVVVPVWCLSASAMALATRDLSTRAARAVASSGALVIAIGLGWVIWASFDPEGCAFGPRTPSYALIGPSLLVGLILGGGWAASGLAGRSAAVAGSPWRAAGLAFALAFGDVLVTIGAASFLLLSVGGCNRPP
jgi:hypothetical protein